MPADHPPVGAADQSLARYVRQTVYPYSSHYRAVLDQAGVGRRMRGRADLRRIPPTDLAEIGDPAALVLRPDLRTIARHGQRGFAIRAMAAKATGGMNGFNRRVVERRFKPIHWMLEGGVAIGYSSADLDRLAKHGAAWLQRAGVGRHDVVLSLLPSGPSVAHWQLVLGCRRAGVSAIHLDPRTEPSVADRMAPSAVAGHPGELIAVLAGARAAGYHLSNLRTLLVIGDPIGADLRRHLQALGKGAAVVGAWGPPGVRAVWSECRPGSARPEPTGYHASDTEVLESGAGGELLWTGLGWGGGAVLRLRTFTVVSLDDARCPACGRPGPRITPISPVSRLGGVVAGPVAMAAAVPAVAAAAVPAESTGAGGPVVVTNAEAVLDAEAEVAAWQVEYRTVDGRPETIVVLAPAWGAALVPLIRRLDRHLRATQFVVLTPEEIAARIDSAGGRRILGGVPA